MTFFKKIFESKSFSKYADINYITEIIRWRNETNNNLVLTRNVFLFLIFNLIKIFTSIRQWRMKTKLKILVAEFERESYKFLLNMTMEYKHTMTPQIGVLKYNWKSLRKIIWKDERNSEQLFRVKKRSTCYVFSTLVQELVLLRVFNDAYSFEIW